MFLDDIEIKFKRRSFESVPCELRDASAIVVVYKTTDGHDPLWFEEKRRLFLYVGDFLVSFFFN